MPINNFGKKAQKKALVPLEKGRRLLRGATLINHI